MISITTITIKTTKPRAVAAFWRDLLGYEVAPNLTDSVLLEGNGPSLLIQPATRPAAPGAIHLDLRPDDQGEAVAAALALGASHADILQTGQEGWVVLADPAGNLFCVLEGRAAHAARMTGRTPTPTPVCGHDEG